MISLLSSAMKEVRQAMNATYWVPPEILERIFRHIPGSILDESQDYRDRADLPFWLRNHGVLRTRDIIPLTHVCQRWRKIVKNILDLWCDIDSRMRIPYGDYLRLSRGLPLGAYFHGKPCLGLVEWLQVHAVALQELHCITFGYGGGLDYDWEPLLQITFPNLRVATFHGTYTMTEDETFEMSSSLLNYVCRTRTGCLRDTSRTSLGSSSWAGHALTTRMNGCSLKLPNSSRSCERVQISSASPSVIDILLTIDIIVTILPRSWKRVRRTSSGCPICST